MATSEQVLAFLLFRQLGDGCLTENIEQSLLGFGPDLTQWTTLSTGAVASLQTMVQVDRAFDQLDHIEDRDGGGIGAESDPAPHSARPLNPASPTQHGGDLRDEVLGKTAPFGDLA